MVSSLRDRPAAPLLQAGPGEVEVDGEWDTRVRGEKERRKGRERAKAAKKTWPAADE